MSMVFGFLVSVVSSPIVTAVVSALFAGYTVGRLYGGRPVRDGIVGVCEAISGWADGVSYRFRPLPDDLLEPFPHRERYDHRLTYRIMQRE